MKIYEFCLYYNEADALGIKQREASRWIDELHLCEATQTFRARDKPSNLAASDDFTKVHIFDSKARFHPEYKWGVSRYAPFFRKKDMARKNETLQRNFVHEVLAPEDDDIVILSDVDEIIDSRHADEIVEAAKKHGVVSLRIHHTLFFLNLYSTNWHEIWPGSPQDYAYRIFVMTGKHFRTMKYTSDRIRRLGEWGKLGGEVHLMEGMRGFHHSWLGDEKAALAKLKAYAHHMDHHSAELVDSNTGEASVEKLGQMIREGRSIFPGNQLEVRDFEKVPQLTVVSDNPDRYAHLVL